MPKITSMLLPRCQNSSKNVKKNAPSSPNDNPEKPKEAGGGKLLGICFVLFSPLALVQFESVKTLARLAAQKADQK